MFDSLKHWFESVDTESSLFEHPEEETVHVALASLLFHVISSDNVVSGKEKHEFCEILSKEFALNEEQVASLYKQVKTLKSDLSTDLATVNHYLKHNPQSRMLFMKKLNHLISLNGVTSEEMKIFYDAQRVIFPELATEDKF